MPNRVKKLKKAVKQVTILPLFVWCTCLPKCEGYIHMVSGAVFWDLKM